MKHYNELSEVESAIIDMSSFKATVRVFFYGAPQATREDVEAGMYNISDQFDHLQLKLEDRFYQLFDAVRDETNEKEKRFGTGCE